MSEPPPWGQQGQWVPPQQWGAPPPASGPPTNALAIVGFGLAFFIFPAGFVIGLVALSQIKRTGEAGRGLIVPTGFEGFLESQRYSGG